MIDFIQLYAGWFIAVSIIAGLFGFICFLVGLEEDKEGLGLFGFILLIVGIFGVCFSTIRYDARDNARDKAFDAAHSCTSVPYRDVSITYEGTPVIFKGAYTDTYVKVCTN